MDRPPYQVIAADLADRIARGELAPGDRVPSTRQLAAERGVALATAAKALTALRRDGLVRTQDRVGTVVAPPRRLDPAARRVRPGRLPDGTPHGIPHGIAHGVHRPGPLTPERIVAAGIAIADAEGLGAVSMRTVAARLGVSVMSSYRHVGGKDDLVRLMADAVFAAPLTDRPAPGRTGPAGPAWRDELAAAVRDLWDVHRAHPWLAHLGPLTRPLTLPHLLAYSERMLAALEGRGLDAAASLDLVALLYGYVLGLAANFEREAQAADASGLSAEQFVEGEVGALDAIVAGGAYPAFGRTLTALVRDGYDLDLDALFELGLGCLLDGLARRLDPA